MLEADGEQAHKIHHGPKSRPVPFAPLPNPPGKQNSRLRRLLKF